MSCSFRHRRSRPPNKATLIEVLLLLECLADRQINAGKALIVMEGSNKNAILSARNIPEVKTASVNTINTYDVLKYNTLVVTKEAVAKIEEVYA